MADERSPLIPWIIGGLGALAVGVYYLDITSQYPERYDETPKRKVKKKKKKPKKTERKSVQRRSKPAPRRKAKAEKPKAIEPPKLKGSYKGSAEPGYTSSSRGDWRVRWYNDRDELIGQKAHYKKTLSETSKAARIEPPPQASWWNVRDMKNGRVAAEGRF